MGYYRLVTLDSATKSSGATLDYTGLQVTFSASVSNGVKSSIGQMTGKWYCEVTLTSGTTGMIGIADSTVNPNSVIYNATGTRFYSSGNKYSNGTASTYGATYTTNDTISILLDMDNKKLEFWKNGVSQGVAFTDLGSLVGNVFIALGNNSNTSTATFVVNFGSVSTPFKYTVPTGYIAYSFAYYYKNFFYSTNGRTKTFNLPDNTKSSVPVMTSTTAPSGKVTSSSVQGANYDWNAFDGVITGNGWLGAGTTNQWIAYEFPTSKIITRYAITVNYNITSAPKDFIFQASNDNGITWDTLDTQSNITSWVLGAKKTFSVKNTKLYKIYRLYATTNNGGTYINVTEMEMFEDFGEVVTVSTAMPTESDFINFGMDTITINPLKINIKKYITSNKTVLGSGNTFDKTLDITGSKINSLMI
jgi:hypothetical protein